LPQEPLIAATVQLPNKAVALQKGDAQGAAVVAQRHGDQYEAAYAGSIGMAANPGLSGITTSAGLATTYLGICLSNPAGSGKNLSVLRVSGQIIVAPATLTGYGLITGYAAGGITVHTTPLTVQQALIGQVAGDPLVGLVDSACTLVGTPIWSDWLGVTPAATSVLSFSRAVGGAILIPPGGYMAVGSNIAGPAAGFLGSVVWEENPA